VRERECQGADEDAKRLLQLSQRDSPSVTMTAHLAAPREANQCAGGRGRGRERETQLEREFGRGAELEHERVHGRARRQERSCACADGLGGRRAGMKCTAPRAVVRARGRAGQQMCGGGKRATPLARERGCAGARGRGEWRARAAQVGGCMGESASERTKSRRVCV
jgi:hypothetical protein